MTEVIPSFQHAATVPRSLSCSVRKFRGHRKIAEELVRKRSCKMANYSLPGRIFCQRISDCRGHPSFLTAQVLGPVKLRAEAGA